MIGCTDLGKIFYKRLDLRESVRTNDILPLLLGCERQKFQSVEAVRQNEFETPKPIGNEDSLPVCSSIQRRTLCTHNCLYL